MNTIGTCSRCGGPVQAPILWLAPPIPTCTTCKAVAHGVHGPIILTMAAEPQAPIDSLGDPVADMPGM